MKRCLVIGTINRYPTPPGWEYIHADLSARPIYDIETGRHVPIANVQDMRDLTYEDESFDRIQCWHALEHVNQEGGERTCREFHRVLRPKGVLDVCVPDLSDLQSHPDIDSILTYVYGQQPGPYDIDPEFQVHRWGYTERSLRALLDEVGFSSVERVHDGDLHLLAQR